MAEQERIDQDTGKVGDPSKPGEQLRSCVDPALAGRTLDWRAQTPIHAGLKETLRSFAAL